MKRGEGSACVGMFSFSALYTFQSRSYSIILNFALKDQRLAIDRVTDHIAGFGGDKVCPYPFDYGPSAGAGYAHAHRCTSTPVKRGILQSGSLYWLHYGRDKAQ
ncbi:hypothetical protein BKA61DRAFT_664481 [Leptodontidium sp. MPI-SDFR-AT-0119]|nr:hypothetical protein BKA61DRAFT_664481 [Leptodontidium sp. MPI-SDFR-AT-0119]